MTRRIVSDKVVTIIKVLLVSLLFVAMIVMIRVMLMSGPPSVNRFWVL